MRWFYSRGKKRFDALWDDGVLVSKDVALLSLVSEMTASGQIVSCGAVGPDLPASLETQVAAWGTITEAVSMLNTGGGKFADCPVIPEAIMDSPDNDEAWLMEKASFGGDRSAAGRYAAEQRWKGHAKVENNIAELTVKYQELTIEMDNLKTEINLKGRELASRMQRFGMTDDERSAQRAVFLKPLFEKANALSTERELVGVAIQNDVNEQMSISRPQSVEEKNQNKTEFDDAITEFTTLNDKLIKDIPPHERQNLIVPQPDLKTLEPEKWQKLRNRYVVADDPTLKMNKALRGETPMSAGDKARASEAKWLTSGVAPVPFIVGRSMSLPLSVAKSIKSGLVFESKGYQSSELGMDSKYNRQDQFLGYIFTQMVIKVPKGAHMAHLGYSEVVLRPGRLKIVASKWNGKQLDVVAELLPQEA